LSLDRRPLFDYDPEYGGQNKLAWPEETWIDDADLYAGDALLFMGRHLVHFRRGKLGEGHWVNNAFLHFVQENFNKEFA